MTFKEHQIIMMSDVPHKKAIQKYSAIQEYHYLWPLANKNETIC